jgi:ABC-type phosphate transport system permease subunit
MSNKVIRISQRVRAAWNALLGRPTIVFATFTTPIHLSTSNPRNMLIEGNRVIHEGQ